MAARTPETTGCQAHTAVAAPGEASLEAYRHEKLQLADVLLSLLHIAEARRDGERSEQIRGISARLAEDRFQLAVVGQFSRGKSTLMNAILGKDYLPTGALPMTSVITTVVYGSRPRAAVWRGDALPPIETPLSELVRYVAQASREREELGVTSALIELPAELLRLGFSFVDTPGVGSAIVANTKATQGFLPQSDAVIFVASFDSPLSETELAFLRSVRDEVKRIFVVLNKRDLVSDAEASEIQAFVFARLKEVGIEEPDVFALSARDGLAAKLYGDLQGVLDSGLEVLESELTDYLTTEAISRGLDGTLARQLVSATAGRLKRRSEDMRTYSLKRLSLRRRFIDQEEERAYRDVLLRLAGHPLLAGVIPDGGPN